MKLNNVIFVLVTIGVVGYSIWYMFQANSAAAPTLPSVATSVNPSASEYTYVNASGDTIRIDAPQPQAALGKTFTVSGTARGPWFFEASFPVNVLDANGNVLFQGPAQAQGDWMTNDFVPFSIQVTIAGSYTGPATLVLTKDNPSGEAQNDASLSFPITIQ